MKGCKGLQDLIALHASDDLAEKDRRRVEQHLQSCPECRRAAAAMRELVAAASRERVAPPQGLADRVMQRMQQRPLPARQPPFRWFAALGYAAGLAVVFGAGILLGMQLTASSVHGGAGPVAASPPVSPARHHTDVAAGPPAREAPATVEQEEPAPAASMGYVGRAFQARRGSARAGARALQPRHPDRGVAAEHPALSPPPSLPEPPAPSEPPAIEAPLPAGLDDARLASAPEEEPGW